MITEQNYRENIQYDRRIVITRTGEYNTEYHLQKIVQSSSFELPIPTITKLDLAKELLYPDKFELILLGTSFLLNVIFMGTLIGQSPLNPNMIVFWGIFNFIFTTTRWSYWGPIHFASRMKMMEDELMKGKIVVDFKFAGIIASFVLISIGVILA